MQNQNKPTNAKTKNILVIAVLVVIALALIMISRLTMNRQPDLSALSVTLPPTAAPAAMETPAAETAPTETETPTFTAAPEATEETKAGDAASNADAQAFVLISVGGRLTQIEPLDEDRDVEITQETGETNVIHITHNGFHMKSSTCDNQLCISEGEVTVDNYTRRILGPYVLCLPNQVELEMMVINATTPPDAPDI
ncbi:MAG: NusG domain II-containing protein [Clostridia bacterium]|nr:NusG domain II-containing protein [Clostridia bacterium]